MKAVKILLNISCKLYKYKFCFITVLHSITESCVENKMHLDKIEKVTIFF